MADTLTYAWSATCYPVQTPAANGTFANGTSTSATWTAPAIVPASCVLQVAVTDQHDNVSTGYLIVAVQSTGAGDANVTVYANTWPVVSATRTRVYYDQPDVSGSPPVFTTNTVAHMRLMTVTDPDGDTLAYAWSNDCGGVLAPMVMSGMTMPDDRRVLTVADDQSCNVTVVVTDLCTAGNCSGLGLVDGAPRGGSTSVVFHIPAKWSATPITPPGAPTAVAARLASNSSVSVSFTAPADTGGSAITNYAVTSSGGLTAAGTTSPIAVACTGSCAGQTFQVTAYNAGGPGTASTPANVVTNFAVVATWYEPMYHMMAPFKDSVFTGSYTLDSTTRTVSALQGSLTQSMTPYPMATLALLHQLSALSDGLGGNGQLVTTFLLNAVDTFSATGSTVPPSVLADPSLATWWPGGQYYYGYPGVPYASATPNAYAMVLVDTDAPAGTATAAQLSRTAYADCTPMGLMGGNQCMTGTDASVYGRIGTMGAYPLSQVTSIAP
jgi:hypothetical protein